EAVAVGLHQRGADAVQLRRPPGRPRGPRADVTALAAVDPAARRQARLRAGVGQAEDVAQLAQAALRFVEQVFKEQPVIVRVGCTLAVEEAVDERPLPGEAPDRRLERAELAPDAGVPERQQPAGDELAALQAAVP